MKASLATQGMGMEDKQQLMLMMMATRRVLYVHGVLCSMSTVLISKVEPARDQPLRNPPLHHGPQTSRSLGQGGWCMELRSIANALGIRSAPCASGNMAEYLR